MMSVKSISRSSMKNKSFVPTSQARHEQSEMQRVSNQE
jgi:hypothetical protein